tara:strand:- start:375 stop:3281 length:2907 start_codon:yes stop_codon:yes gene_type:complete
MSNSMTDAGPVARIHPRQHLRAAATLYKRRGKLTATVRSDWVERLFVLSDSALFWFDLEGGPLDKLRPALHLERSSFLDSAQQGRCDVRHVVSINTPELAEGALFGRTPEELQRLGPRYQLEITTVLAEPLAQHVLGCNNKAELEEWHAALSRAVAQVLPQTSTPPPPPSDGLMRLDLLGVLALGHMQKAREGMLKGGWSVRFLVLTREHLIFFKQTDKASGEDEPEKLFGTLGATIRSGEFIFGQERGRMAMANADVAADVVSESGRRYTQLTLTGALSGLDHGSMLQKGINKISKVSEGTSRFKAVLRTEDPAEAAEWVAVLRHVCGHQRQQSYAKLEAAISTGDAHVAASVAQELALLAAAVPSLSRPRADSVPNMGSFSARPSRPSGEFAALPSTDYGEPGEPGSPQAIGVELASSDEEMVEVDVELDGGGGRDKRSSSRSKSELQLLSENQLLRAKVAKQEANLRAMQAALLQIAESATNAAEPTPARLAPTLPSHLSLQLPLQLPLTVDAPPPAGATAASSSGAGAATATHAETMAEVEQLEAEGNHLQAAELMAAQLEMLAKGQLSSPRVARGYAGGGGAPSGGTTRTFAVSAAEVKKLEVRGSTITVQAEPAEPAEPAENVSDNIEPPPEMDRSTSEVTAASECHTSEQIYSDPTDKSEATAVTTTSERAPAPAPAPEPVSAPAPAPAPPRATPREGEAGYTLVGSSHMQQTGNGTTFAVRIGPSYKRYGKKEPSLPQVYELAAVDLIKRPTILYDVAKHIKLPPPPDVDQPNDTGLPRRLIVNMILPTDAPSLTSAKTDGECIQLIFVFTQSAAKLKAWQASGAPAAKLFTRWCAEAEHNTELKERLKLLSKVENIADLGSAMSFVKQYNGKPVLITKSGRISRGDDSFEMAMNAFRFSYITKKGVKFALSRGTADMEIMSGITIEGREDDELPEQMIGVAHFKGIDFLNQASEALADK